LTKRREVTPLDSIEVESIAKDCSQRAQKGDFTIIYTAHARDQMEKRYIDQKHVLQVLEFGRLVEGQTRFDDKENDYSYLLRDLNVEERDMAVSIAISQTNGIKVIIVTAMLIDPTTGKFI
jgi:hypothetical protein